MAKELSKDMKIDVSKPIEQLPAHLQGKDSVRGSENVGTSDIIIRVWRSDTPRRRYSMEIGVRTPVGEFGRHYQFR